MCEDDIIVNQVESPEIVDDFEIGQDEVVNIKDKDANKQKEGKKLLVLDIDYTLFDHRSTAENPQLMRPYLHEFLTAAYADMLDHKKWESYDEANVKRRRHT
nr:At4G06599-like protein [Tanacetum cinerariifolium]